MIVRFLVWLLRYKKISEKDRTFVLNALLESIKSVPLRYVISTDNNRNIYVMGKPLSIEEALSLRDSASAVLNSKVRKLVQDQIRFKAIEDGYLKNYDPVKGVFYKAALWYSQQENELLEELSGEVVTTVD